MDGPQPDEPKPRSEADQQFHFVATSVAELLGAATRELERDKELAKATLAAAANLLQAEIARIGELNASPAGGLADWQLIRVREYIDSNLARNIRIRDLSAIARRSPAYFSRRFKFTVGEAPHAYVMRRRLQKACRLMITTTASLSEIAISVGFSDQSHLSRIFRQTFGQSPASWRRHRESSSDMSLER